LEVVYKDAAPVVALKGKSKIILQARPNSSVEKRGDLMMEWYRKELFPVADELMAKWQKRIGVQVNYWGIKRMKTRWGTCNNKDKRILLNLELAKKPIACLEYVIVHELLHMIEKKHNDNFLSLLAKYIPKWGSVKEELNRLMLSHEEWSY
jgi:predicted metal-dependent hydrolase